MTSSTTINHQPELHQTDFISDLFSEMNSIQHKQEHEKKQTEIQNQSKAQEIIEYIRSEIANVKNRDKILKYGRFSLFVWSGPKDHGLRFAAHQDVDWCSFIDPPYDLCNFTDIVEQIKQELNPCTIEYDISNKHGTRGCLFRVINCIEQYQLNKIGEIDNCQSLQPLHNNRLSPSGQTLSLYETQYLESLSKSTDTFEKFLSDWGQHVKATVCSELIHNDAVVLRFSINASTLNCEKKVSNKIKLQCYYVNNLSIKQIVFFSNQLRQLIGKNPSCFYQGTKYGGRWGLPSDTMLPFPVKCESSSELKCFIDFAFVNPNQLNNNIIIYQDDQPISSSFNSY